MKCPFCVKLILNSRIIIENDLVFAFPTNTPIVPGHILICPKRHVKYYEDLTVEEMSSIECLRNKLKLALKKSLKTQGFNYAWNEEKIGGQSIEHFHLHVVPRIEGDVGVYKYEPREFLYRPRPRTVISPDEELDEIVKIIKKSIK
jgi:diadenosine tetraphosphate (Ap4A) HIT family hydrolase